MKEYEIWMEGFAATGQSQGASYIGRASGKDFNDACKNFRYSKNITNWDNEVIVEEGEPLKLDDNRDYPSIWACRLYDNEADARKSFG